MKAISQSASYKDISFCEKVIGMMSQCGVLEWKQYLHMCLKHFPFCSRGGLILHSFESTKRLFLIYEPSVFDIIINS